MARGPEELSLTDPVIVSKVHQAEVIKIYTDDECTNVPRSPEQVLNLIWKFHFLLLLQHCHVNLALIWLNGKDKMWVCFTCVSDNSLRGGVKRQILIPDQPSC